MLYYWKGSGYLDGAREPLVRGAIGHAGLAQLYARAREAQHGRDPNRYATPSAAMLREADRWGPMGQSMLAVAAPLVREYAERHQHERLGILEVEREREIQFGPYLYTARIDLEVEAADGRVWWYDHKIVAKVEAKTWERYALSGQFLGQTLLGRKVWGERFGGIRLNILGVGNRFARDDIAPAPWILARFPEVVQKAEKRMAEIDLLRESGGFPGASPTEVTCMTPYGPCDAIDLCRWGPVEG